MKIIVVLLFLRFGRDYVMGQAILVQNDNKGEC